MMEPVYAFEKLDVYHAANQLARVVGGLCASLPGKKDRVARKMIRANVVLGMTIAGGNAERSPDEFMSLEDRQEFLRVAQASVRDLRRIFLDLRRDRLGSRSHISAGLELLERIEAGLNENVAQLRPGFDPVAYAQTQRRQS